MLGRHVHWHDAARIAGRMIKGLMGSQLFEALPPVNRVIGASRTS